MSDNSSTHDSDWETDSVNASRRAAIAAAPAEMVSFLSAWPYAFVVLAMNFPVIIAYPVSLIGVCFFGWMIRLTVSKLEDALVADRVDECQPAICRESHAPDADTNERSAIAEVDNPIQFPMTTSKRSARWSIRYAMECSIGLIAFLVAILAPVGGHIGRLLESSGQLLSDNNIHWPFPLLISHGGQDPTAQTIVALGVWLFGWMLIGAAASISFRRTFDIIR